MSDFDFTPHETDWAKPAIWVVVSLTVAAFWGGVAWVFWG